MRSLFDQYTQPENRLTHALLSCLDKDRRLLKRFIEWSVKYKPKGRRLEVHEQSFPGDPIELTEDEAERRGLPDGCIVDGTGWALLIESKVAAAVSVNQLQRHQRTSRRYELDPCTVLLLTVGRYEGQLPKGVTNKQWREVYAWLQRESRQSVWAAWCIDYLEIAETKSAAVGYLQEGTLTMFAGIPFATEPYSYLQAKRLIRLIREELLKDKRLETKLGIDRHKEGRPKITGSAGGPVWDFIRLKHARRANNFTKFPHLTFAIREDRLEAYVTIPDKVKSQIRSAILGEGYEEFEALMLGITKSLIKALRRTKGATPMVVLVQRHYPSQRAMPIHDANLRFDPQTAMVDGKRDKRVKTQPQWLRTTYEALSDRSSNLQLQIGADFEYQKAPITASPEIVTLVADVWMACKPITDIVEAVDRE
jgi:hypothetical protein